MDECDSSSTPTKPIEILRHRAAIRRSDPSRPRKCLLRDRFLDECVAFFDYGC
jgi:hypothetical protein